MTESEQINELVTALAQAMLMFPEIERTQSAKIPTKTGGSYEYEYADLADVLGVIRPVLAKFGLVLVQPITIREGQIVLVTKLLHVSGQWIGSEYPIPSHDRAQEQGSEITYGRRHSAMSLLGLAAKREDDDGKAAQDAPPKPGTAPAARPTPAVAKPAAVPAAQRASDDPFGPPTAQEHRLPPAEPAPGPRAVAGSVPVCNECGTREKVIRSKYAGPTWRCLACSHSFGPPNDIPKVAN
jgi:hypothetical protein